MTPSEALPATATRPRDREAMLHDPQSRDLRAHLLTFLNERSHIRPSREADFTPLPDLAAELGRCRFANCTHREEPQCSVRAAVDAGRISPSRWRIYLELFAELSQTRW